MAEKQYRPPQHAAGGRREPVTINVSLPYGVLA